ncbi:hypothetical protein BH09VER1_BH09VER1_22300 [soil metagenome]
MNEVRVIARFAAKAGKEEELRKLLQGLVVPTHAEAGCKIYELYESDLAGRFYFYELWASEEAFAGHLSTPHLEYLKSVVGDLVGEPFEVNLVKALS